jgi:hypothetical protein
MTNYIAPMNLLLDYYINGTKPTTCLPFFIPVKKITSNDLDSKEPSRSQRGYHFENSIKEVSLGLEFNFSILTFMN